MSTALSLLVDRLICGGSRCHSTHDSMPAPSSEHRFPMCCSSRLLPPSEAALANTVLEHPVPPLRHCLITTLSASVLCELPLGAAKIVIVAVQIYRKDSRRRVEVAEEQLKGVQQQKRQEQQSGCITNNKSKSGWLRRTYRCLSDFSTHLLREPVIWRRIRHWTLRKVFETLLNGVSLTLIYRLIDGAYSKTIRFPPSSFRLQLSTTIVQLYPSHVAISAGCLGWLSCALAGRLWSSVTAAAEAGPSHFSALLSPLILPTTPSLSHHTPATTTAQKFVEVLYRPRGVLLVNTNTNNNNTTDGNIAGTSPFVFSLCATLLSASTLFYTRGLRRVCRGTATAILQSSLFADGADQQRHHTQTTTADDHVDTTEKEPIPQKEDEGMDEENPASSPQWNANTQPFRPTTTPFPAPELSQIILSSNQPQQSSAASPSEQASVAPPSSAAAAPPQQRHPYHWSWWWSSSNALAGAPEEAGSGSGGSEFGSSPHTPNSDNSCDHTAGSGGDSPTTSPTSDSSSNPTPHHRSQLQSGAASPTAAGRGVEDYPRQHPSNAATNTNISSATTAVADSTIRSLLPHRLLLRSFLDVLATAIVAHTTWTRRTCKEAGELPPSSSLLLLPLPSSDLLSLLVSTSVLVLL